MKQYRILYYRNKQYWGESTGVLRQKDAHFKFQINPHDVEGWYGWPRQTAQMQQVERGLQHRDYGINIRDVVLRLTHPILTQDQVDAIVFQTYLRPDALWSITNHRDDTFKAQLSQKWMLNNFRTLYDQPYTPEPELIEDTEYSGAVFAWDNIKIFCAKVVSNKIYMADLDGPFVMMADGTNPTIAATENGNRYLAYERGGRLFMRHQKAGVWQPEISVTRNDDNYFPGRELYDSASTYSSPSLLIVDGRPWLFYIRSKDGESTIEYRLQAQSWLFAHSIATMYGPKTSLKVYLVAENEAYKGCIMVTWINWDWSSSAKTSRIPNLYFVKSTPPQQEYGRNGGLTALQGNQTPVVDRFVLAMTDQITIELRKP